MIKLGLSITTSSYFQCRIAEDGVDQWFEKSPGAFTVRMHHFTTPPPQKISPFPHSHIQIA